MASFEETLTANTFYEQSLNVWSDPDDWSSSCETVDLFTATGIGNYDSIDYLIKNRICDLTKKNSSNWTALMYAVFYGYDKIAELLVNNGAPLHTCNEKGHRALMIAARCGHDRIVEYLIKAGSILEARDKMDWTAVFHAIYGGNIKVLQVLLKYRANVNACIRQSGRTPLIFAARTGDIDMVELLLKNGAIPTFTSALDNGKTAAMIARDAGFSHIATVINQWTSQASATPSLRDGPSAIEYKLVEKHQHNLYRNTGSVPFSKICGAAYSELDILLSQLGLEAYISLFREQQVDLQIFLSMNDQDFKDCGVNKIGPRRKLCAAIARWHSNAPQRTGLEAAYADKLEVDLHECNERLTEMETFALRLKSRLREAHERCRIGREHFASALFIAYHINHQQLTAALTTVSQYLDDLFCLTEFSFSSEIHSSSSSSSASSSSSHHLTR